MSLEEDEAAALLSQLPLRQVERVSLAIAQLDSVSGQEQEQVLASSSRAAERHQAQQRRFGSAPRIW